MNVCRILRGARIALFAALVVAGAWAQEPKAPTQPAFVLPPPPQYRLEPVPQVALDGKAFAASQEETAEIRVLVASLSEIDSRDFGLAPWISGQQFAPMKSWPRPDWLVTPIAVERLVALGPKAIPALLEALDDPAPTKVVVEFGGFRVAQARELQFNPAIEREARVRQAHPELFEGSGRGAFDLPTDRYEVTRGDVCFATLGHVVNRNYRSLRPSMDPLIVAAVREIWRSDDPARRLMDSLLADFCTRDDTTHASTPLQCGAATRLLYYFPPQSAELVARLRRQPDQRAGPGVGRLGGAVRG